MEYSYNELNFNNQDYKSLLSIQLNNILIIGAAGTIGKNYLLNILKLKPKKIICVDTNENGLTELTRLLRSGNLLDYNPEYITYPVNLLDDIFDKIFCSHKFDLVANFAAHKHVRSEKDVFSVEALIRNNVFGAKKLMDLCLKNKPKYFFSVSTDKATNPVNIMGASKLLMENIILSYKDDFRITTARFANVAFSNGSLLEGFEHRIKHYQPLSCPSDIKRFFVTPYQSGQICFLSTFLGNSGDVFFPKLDFEINQIYFKDIALEFIKQKGYEAKIFENEKDAKLFNIEKNHGKYPIYIFKSDTSGEKEYEEFYDSDDYVDLEKYMSLGYLKKSSFIFNSEKLINDFNNLFNSNPNKNDIVELIKKYIQNFNHKETGKNLDQKM